MLACIKRLCRKLPIPVSTLERQQCDPWGRRRSARQALRHALRILLMSEPVESTNGNPFARTVGQPLSCGLSGLSARCHMGNRLPLDIIPVREEALRPL